MDMSIIPARKRSAVLLTQILALTVARRYYLDGHSKGEIAGELGISRFKVARLLDQAHADGLVEIKFNIPDRPFDIDLSARLAGACNLRHAIVVPVGEDNPEVLIATLGQAAATFLKETVDSTQIVGLAWTRVLPEIGAQLDSMTARAVVQLCGAIPAGPAGLTSIDAVRDIARKADCPARMYYAPLVATDKAAAEGIRRQPDVLAAMDLISSVSKAIIGIGAWDKELSTVAASLSEPEQMRIAAKGVVAEIAGSITLNAEGRFVRIELSDRVIGIQAEQLLAIPDRIGIAFGTRKLEAISAAMRGGYINSLITHSEVAELLIAAGTKCGPGNRF